MGAATPSRPHPYAPPNKGVVYLYDRLNKGVATGVGDSAVYGPTNKEVVTPHDPLNKGVLTASTQHWRQVWVIARSTAPPTRES